MFTRTLDRAKEQKNDEFYTQLSDIEKEMRHYKEHFRGRVVFCNCDDPYESNFFKYFCLGFNFLGLKRLIATCYKGSAVSNRQLSLFDDESEDDKTTRVAHKIIINEGIDENGDGAYDLQDIVLSLAKNKNNTLTKLEGDGDFRSDECIELLKESDIVVTNPPFSLFREYVDQLIKYNKDFIIIGNTNALTYKETFKLIKENKIRTGYTNFNVGMYFYVPDSSSQFHREDNGKKMVRVSTSCWFTTLPVKKHQEELTLYKAYSPKDYPKYDNYDAINVDKYLDIPGDYDGIMGVPVTFLDKYNPDQFELIGLCAGAKELDIVGLERNEAIKDARALINGKNTYARIFIRKRGKNEN